MSDKVRPVKIEWKEYLAKKKDWPSRWVAMVYDASGYLFIELCIDHFPTKEERYGWSIKIRGLTHKYNDEDDYAKSADEAKEAAIKFFNERYAGILPIEGPSASREILINSPINHKGLLSRIKELEELLGKVKEQYEYYLQAHQRAIEKMKKVLEG